MTDGDTGRAGQEPAGHGPGGRPPEGRATAGDGTPRAARGVGHGPGHGGSARLRAGAGQQVGVPGRSLERVPLAVPGALLYRHLPAVFRRGIVGGQGALHRAPGGVPGAHRRRHAAGRVAGPPHRQPVHPGPGVLRPHRRPAHPVRDRRRAGHRLPRGPVPAVDRAGRRAGPRGHPGRVHQLGPDRDGPDHGGDGRLGGAPRRAGRRAPRPGRGDQVLPAAVLRPAAAALPAGGPDAGVLGHVRVRGGRVAGGRTCR